MKFKKENIGTRVKVKKSSYLGKYIKGARGTIIDAFGSCYKVRLDSGGVAMIHHTRLRKEFKIGGTD